MKQKIMMMFLCFFLIGLAKSDTEAAEVSLVRGEEIFYEGHSTFYYYIDGELGYCLEPYKKSPHAGDFPAELLQENTLLSKALYYVYGGPGYDAYMKEHFTGQWQEKKQAYCLSHCILSYIYDECKDDSEEFCDLSESMQEQIKRCVELMKGFPEIPCPGIRFSEKNLIACYDNNLGLQVTKETTCIGDSKNCVEIELPESVELVNVTKGTTEKGKVKIWGGDSFYFTADAGMYNGQIWESGELYGTNRQKWRSIIINTGESGQHLGMGHLVTAEEEPDSFSVQWLPKPELQVDKSADREDKKYKVGDKIIYSIDISQRIENAVAKNLIITDTIITEGVSLQKDSIVLLDENQSIVSDAKITVNGNSYSIEPNKCLKGAETGAKYFVEYQVVITDEALIGKEIENEVVVRAENAEAQMDEEIVYVEGPIKPVLPKKPESVKTGDEQKAFSVLLLCILSCVTVIKCGIINKYKSN